MKLFWEKYKWLKRIFVAVCSYLSVLSMAKLISLHGIADVYWGYKYFGYNMGAVILLCVTAWLFNRYLLRQDMRLKVTSGIGGVLLSMAMVYGAYAHYVNDIFMSTGESLLQIAMVLGICVLTIPVSAELLLWFDRVRIWFGKETGRQETDHKVVLFFRKHQPLYFVFAWAVIFCSYMPLFLACWPGNFVFDAKYQLQNVIENWYKTHHPLIHTLLMGKAYQLGQRVGDVSWGYQFYTLFQMLVLSSAFAYLVYYLYKKGVRRCFRVGVLLWFALFPMHALFAVSSTKDVLCAAFFLYFMVFLFRLLADGETFKWYSYAGMIVSGVLVSLFRNNVLYAVIVTGIILAIAIRGWKNRGKALLLILTVSILTQLANEGLIRYTHAIESDTYREMLCVPLQGLARVADYRGGELEPELYDEICRYIRPMDISAYNPYLADPIKNNANEELLKTNTGNFFKLWAKVGMRFPDEYLESIITNTMGYWYPLNQGVYVSYDIALYHTLIGMGDEIVKKSYCDWADKIYSALFWTTDYRYVPVLGVLFRIMPYIWLVVYYMLWCIYKKDKKGALVGVLPMIYILTCFCGPAAALRYIYSIVVCVPLFLYGIFSAQGADKQEMN